MHRFTFISFILLMFSRALLAQVYTYDELYRELDYKKIELTVRSSEKMESLRMYTDVYDSYYKEINGYLRFHPGPYDWYSVTPHDAKEYVEDIDSLIEDHPLLPKGIILFRGTGLNWAKGSLEINQTFEDKAYTSTSLSVSEAMEFLNEESSAMFILYFGGEAVLRGILINPTEKEVLLDRDLTFKVMDKKSQEERRVYLVQICGKKKCDDEVNNPDAKKLWDSFPSDPLPP